MSTPEALDLDRRIPEILRRVWGFEGLRPVQREVVEAAMGGRDAVVVMPTGGGKSLCFQLPALLRDRLTVVVSPLIALMKDQVDALQLVGVPSAALNSSQSPEEEAETRQRLRSGELRLLYVSPERLLLSSTLELLRAADGGRGVAQFAIDEAHCISAWGHDFRPEYRQMGRIKELFPEVPIQAFTATATPRVQRDIAIQLQMVKPRRFVGTFDRPNLTYRIVAKDNPVQRTLEAVNRYPDEGVIVYCLSRKDTESIANALVANGIPAVAYHAGSPNELRRKISEDFAREKVNVVAATIAFGMGIDRANVRCVIHECLPKSMEGYQQETGRAGRDGLPSECVLLYSYGDVVRLRKLLGEGDPQTAPHHLALLEEVQRYATSHQCRHKTLSEYFGQVYEVPAEGCGACDVCAGGMQELEEGDDVARQLLRAVDEITAGGRAYGAAFVVSVLNGSRQKAVTERGADRLGCFGRFSGETKERVAAWLNQLMDQGLLQTSEGQYPVVTLTASGREALASNLRLRLVENQALLAPAGKARGARGGLELEGADRGLFETLRAWRREVAAQRAVPAYVILQDATLLQISAIRPSTREGLQAISGIGERRAEEFGEALLRLVASSGLPLDQSLGGAVVRRPSPPMSPKVAEYGGFFRQGRSVAEVARATGVTPRTVWTRLAEWVELDRPESIDLWVDPAVARRVAEAHAQLGDGPLRPLYEALGEEVSYEEIRVVLASLAGR